MSKIRFEMTRAEALALGLLACRCGHRENNHFTWAKKQCAHCKCKRYEEQPVVGRVLP